jgi:hypothetical protein
MALMKFGSRLLGWAEYSASTLFAGNASYRLQEPYENSFPGVDQGVF